MQETIQAVYENGVIKPLQEVHLREHEKLTVTISKTKPARKEKVAHPAMGLVGIFDSSIGDLSKEHDEYLYGWKKAK